MGEVPTGRGRGATVLFLDSGDNDMVSPPREETIAVLRGLVSLRKYKLLIENTFGNQHFLQGP